MTDCAMRTIIYPGTFDPITDGHTNLVERASKLFDRVVIAIARSKQKTPLFNFPERVELCKQVLSHLDNIEVCGFSGLIVELMKRAQSIKWFVSSVREVLIGRYLFRRQWIKCKNNIVRKVQFYLFTL